MATPSELATRALRKIHALGAVDTASAEDLAIAVQGITDAHNALDTQGLLRWTLNDIPSQVDLAYVQICAYLIADDFVQPKDAGWMTTGMALVQSYVQIPASTCNYGPDDF